MKVNIKQKINKAIFQKWIISFLLTYQILKRI
jgi:hypothetical protein